MRTLLKIALGIFIVIFLLSGIFSLICGIFNLTFGIIGALISLAWKIIFSPVILILIIIYLLYKLKKSTN